MGAENKYWAIARREAKRKGVKLDRDAMKGRVEVLKQIACPMRVSVRRLNRQDEFFKGVERRYGLSRESYLRLMHEQNSACCVCSRELVLFSHRADERPVVDHDHGTGAVRGLLCHGCNVRVGRVEFSAEKRLYDAAREYVRRKA